MALLKTRETGGRPLLGSVPIMNSLDEALTPVETQDGNPNLDTALMPLAHRSAQ